MTATLPRAASRSVTISPLTALATTTNLRSHTTTNGIQSVLATGLASLGGKLLIMDSTGIQVMESSNIDDNGNPIVANLRTCLSDLGTHHIKRVPDVWLGVRDSGALSATVETDERIARVLNKSDIIQGVHELRIKLPRGVKSRYWRFGVGNVSGSDFQLESIVTEPQELSRRVR